MLLAALLILGGVRFGLPLWRARNANYREMKQPLPQFALPGPGDRVLILAPHCDDETLGCGGLIEQALRAGAQVKVALVTNGDGFRLAASRWFEEIKVPPKDFRRFAGDRRQESLKALAILGLPKKQAVFLGYPDGGTAQMWLDFWSPTNPYTSPHTKENRNPYGDSFHPGAPYCGRALLEDLGDLLRQYRPTLVVCPDPNENHPDHWALYAYTLGALYESGLLGKTELRVYLVHRGDWPLPQGLYPNKTLSPPASLVGLGTHWESLPLGNREEKRKLTAIRKYRSQLRVMGRFIFSFARVNELFGSPPLPRLPHIDFPSDSAGGQMPDWSRQPPVLLEPGPDQALTDIYPASDITKLYAAQSGRRLFIGLELLKPPSRKLSYSLYLHPLLQNKVGPPQEYRMRLGGQLKQGEFKVSGRRLEISLPWGKSWRGVMLGAISRKGKRVLDKTAWVLLRSEAPVSGGKREAPPASSPGK